jgi:DNA-binding response OmpR family regulator
MSTILVVDDDQVLGGLLRTVLELEGYQAVVVARREDVVPTARQINPALVLMDVHISHGDTLDVLRELKADETLKTTPVMMTSGIDRSAECLAAGADDFLLKPFRPAEVMTMIANLINK